MKGGFSVPSRDLLMLPFDLNAKKTSDNVDLCRVTTSC